MRNAYAGVGIGFLILILGVWMAFNSTFRTPGDNRDATITHSSTIPMADDMTLTSSEFAANASIPSKYTCDGEQINPPLSISGVPDGARSLALVMDDPDVPKQLKPDGVFDHWVLFNVPPETSSIAAGMTVGTPGANGTGKPEYTGPCPPPQYEPREHRYVFTLYALDTELSLTTGASKQEVLAAMEGHILAKAELIGRYARQ